MKKNFIYTMIISLMLVVIYQIQSKEIKTEEVNFYENIIQKKLNIENQKNIEVKNFFTNDYLLFNINISEKEREVYILNLKNNEITKINNLKGEKEKTIQCINNNIYTDLKIKYDINKKVLIKEENAQTIEYSSESLKKKIYNGVPSLERAKYYLTKNLYRQINKDYKIFMPTCEIVKISHYDTLKIDKKLNENKLFYTLGDPNNNIKNLTNNKKENNSQLSIHAIELLDYTKNNEIYYYQIGNREELKTSQSCINYLILNDKKNNWFKYCRNESVIPEKKQEYLSIKKYKKGYVIFDKNYKNSKLKPKASIMILDNNFKLIKSDMFKSYKKGVYDLKISPNGCGLLIQNNVQKTSNIYKLCYF